MRFHNISCDYFDKDEFRKIKRKQKDFLQLAMSFSFLRWFLDGLTITRVMATKLCRMVTGHSQPPKTHEPLIDHVVLQDYVTNHDHHISTITVHMVTKLGSEVTYLRRSHP